MRHPSVALATAFLVAAFLATAAPAAERKAGDAGKSGSAGKSTGLLIAGEAESSGAKLALTQPAKGNASNAEADSAVPPGRRCDPNDPRPGCQPLPKSPKK